MYRQALRAEGDGRIRSCRTPEYLISRLASLFSTLKSDKGNPIDYNHFPYQCNIYLGLPYAELDEGVMPELSVSAFSNDNLVPRDYPKPIMLVQVRLTGSNPAFSGPFDRSPFVYYMYFLTFLDYMIYPRTDIRIIFLFFQNQGKAF